MNSRQLTAPEFRSIIIFWAVVALLILGAFAADGLLRHQTCISAMTVEAGQDPVVYPEVCQ